MDGGGKETEEHHEEIELQEYQHTEDLFPSDYEKQDEKCTELKRQWWIFRYYLRKNIVQSPIFENFILLAILSNCVFLAMESPTLEEDKPELRKLLDDAEYVYFWIFLLEMILKMISFGLH